MTGKPLEPLPPCKLCGSAPDIWLGTGRATCAKGHDVISHLPDDWRRLMSPPAPQAGGLDLKPIKQRDNVAYLDGTRGTGSAIDRLTLARIDVRALIAEIESLRTQNQSAERRGWERGRLAATEAPLPPIYPKHANDEHVKSPAWEAGYLAAAGDIEETIRALKPEE